jgi:hypothetical protein
MGLLYLLIGAAWMVAMVMYMNDLMRLQFWIGGVAFICTASALALRSDT